MNRILHVIGAMNRAGAETLIMNIYRQIDRTRIQFDFLVHTTEQCDYDAEIISLGGRIHRLPEYRGLNSISYRKKCHNFFLNHPEYKIVHGHIGKGAPIYLSEAKKLGCKTIAHAHSENFYKGVYRIAFKAATFPTRYIADSFMACSPNACRATFGKKIEKSGSYYLLKNGIDLSSYKCTHELHLSEKASLKLSDKIVFCHVGRFVEVKNHQFLIKTFKIVQDKIPNSVLLLCGDGPLRPQIHELVLSLQLENSVYFFGIRNDISNILKASDVFIFPSISEGVGLAAIEAQASGTICILSTGVPKAAVASENAIRLPLADGEDQWANIAIKAYRDYDSSKRTNDNDQVGRNGYDIRDTSKWLQNYYKNLLCQ